MSWRSSIAPSGPPGCARSSSSSACRPASPGGIRHSCRAGRHSGLRLRGHLPCSPPLLVADEAVSAVDVSVGAQILNLLDDLPARVFAISVSLHLARSQRDRERERSRRGDVSRQGGGARPDRRRLRLATASLHGCAPLGHAHLGSGSGSPPGAHHPSGRSPEPGQPACRLPLPHALPDRPAGPSRNGPVRRGRAAARPPATRRASSRG